MMSLGSSPSHPLSDEYLTAEQVATLFKWSPATVRNYACLGRLPSIKIGKSLRFRRRDLDRLIEERPMLGGRPR